ncbi:unnamed protein product [Soboliphyme baturini]|uniref:Transthyretin-like family protein n=1 Tax=Soboliphyme baturini TaxID=241478 RepID=A0A183IGZ3_9BILA|nr:unnamed protein product [Soboliphyme baturini]
MQKALLVLIFQGVLVQSLSLFGGGVQRIRAYGRLKCGEAAAAGVKVMLIDIDTGGFDDVMTENKTNSNGEFWLDGQTSEMTSIDPVVKIYHNCDDEKTLGTRRLKIGIPKKYIGKSSSIPKLADLGVINLEMIVYEEERNIF